MARFIPLFPLNIVVFPGEKLNLHIFEPRYKQLIQECFSTNTTFAIPPFLENKIDSMATEIKIISIEKTYPNGEMDIKTKGTGLLRVLEFFTQAPNKFYPAGTVEEVFLQTREDPYLKIQITDCIRQLYSILGINKLFMELPDHYQVFDIAHHLGLKLDQELELLHSPTEKERQELVLAHLHRILPVLLETEKLKDRVRLNGHFKTIQPPNF